MKQPDKLTAYYFRAALQTDTLYLDNQMQKLLYHASQNGIATFALYVDNGYNGLNFDRPAFSLMQQDMKNVWVFLLKRSTATMPRWIAADSYMLHLPRKVVSAVE